MDKVDDRHITYDWWKENNLNTDIDTFWTFDFEEYVIRPDSGYTKDFVWQKMHDKYFHFFLNMFEEADIHFEEAYVIDGRMSADEAQKRVAEADVIWLSGGDTPTQFGYFQKYSLDTVIKQHDGIIIGMSAGSINMAKTSICTLSCGHFKKEIYNGLACVDISVEPHFIRNEVSDELIDLSKKYTIYGLCDESFIVCSGETIEFYGEIYILSQGNIERV